MKRKKAKRPLREGAKKYPGILGQKRKIRTELLDIIGGNPERFSSNFPTRSARNMEGIRLLLAHYKIEESDQVKLWSKLALALATDHVPYFQQGTLRQPEKADRAEQFRLAYAVNCERRKGAKSDAAAIGRLIADGRYLDDPEALTKRLMRARKDAAVIAALHLAEGGFVEIGHDLDDNQIANFAEVAKLFGHFV